MWFWGWWQGRQVGDIKYQVAVLEKRNQENQLAVIALENRLHELSVQRVSMHRELDVMQQIPIGWPLVTSSRVTSAYGMRMHPIEKRRKKHNGIDLACHQGESVLTTAPGVISESYFTKGFGHQVTVTHNFGFRSRYAHLQKRQVKVGQWVDKHDVIGLCGQSGLANGPHLHYEVRYVVAALNPDLFINLKLDQFELLVTNTESVIPWTSFLNQIVNRPHLVSIKSAPP
jgi:murein DD-endopeptidase MepM/ murein hydrolase activator NlpD